MKTFDITIPYGDTEQERESFAWLLRKMNLPLNTERVTGIVIPDQK